VSASYDDAYDTAANLSEVAGSYSGASGHLNVFGAPGSTTAAIDAAGNVSIRGANCDFAGRLMPRATANVFDASLKGAGVSCAAIPSLQAIVLYDAARGRLAVLSAVFRNPFYGLLDVYAFFGTRR
jgi:hypothetical protein